MPLPHIDSYNFGNIVIDGRVHTKDVILLPDRVISGWWRQEGHVLHITDLETVIAAKPQVLVIGQGTYSRMRVTPEVEDSIATKGIEVISLPTKDACLEYNRRSKSEKVAAALHLTC